MLLGLSQGHITSKRSMPYKDYEKQKQRAREYYYENREAILAKNAEPEENAKRRARCRDHHHKTRYNLTAAQAEEMRNTRTGCDICGGLPRGGPWPKFAIDHNHETGQVRGVLCNECNQAIGKLQDDPSIVLRAAEYLSFHEELANGLNLQRSTIAEPEMGSRADGDNGVPIPSQNSMVLGERV